MKRMLKCQFLLWILYPAQQAVRVGHARQPAEDNITMRRIFVFWNSLRNTEGNGKWLEIYIAPFLDSLIVQMEHLNPAETI